MSSRLKTAYTGLIIVAIVVIAVAVAGCHDPNYAEPPYYKYSIKVGGLEHFYTDTGLAHIGFPVPEYNGSALLPFSGIVTLDNYRNFSWKNWNSVGLNALTNGPMFYNGTRGVEAVNTGNGSMAVYEIMQTGSYQISLSGTSTPQPDLTVVTASPVILTSATHYTIKKPFATFDPLSAELTFTFAPDVKTARPIIDSLAAKPFYPDLGTSGGNYTRWLDKNNVSGYTTYIYLDEGLKPKDAGNYTLDIDATFSVVVGYRLHGRGPDEHYVYAINESIPANVTGLVPVTIQCFGNVSGRNVYQMFGSFLL